MIQGVIIETMERASALKAKYPNPMDIHFQKLADLCNKLIDEAN